VPSLELLDFKGGLNTRDSPNELALNETPASTQWTLDSRGALKLRGGCVNRIALPGDTQTPAFIFYSQVFDIWLCARKSGANFVLFTRPGDLSGAWTSRGNLAVANPGSMEAAFVEFSGASPVIVITCAATGLSGGGTYTYAPTTLTSVSATIRGNAIALWKNRVWITGYPVSDANGNPTRLFATKVGDVTVFAAPDGLTVDIRDLDAEGLTGCGVTTGALWVFKNRSAYRVYDETDGSYSTVDPAAGCVGPRAVVPLRGKLFTWGQDGIYEWAGASPGKNIAGKVQPLFAYTLGNVDPPTIAQICGGVIGDRLLYGYPVSAFVTNSHLLELDPANGWVMQHQIANSAQDEVTSFATWQGPLVNEAGILFGAIKDGDDLFSMFDGSPGKDDATAYTGSYKTPWLQPSRGKRFRVQRALIEGLLEWNKTNTMQITARHDWSLGGGETYDITTPIRGASAVFEQMQTDLRSLGQQRAIQFEIQAGNALGTAELRSIGLDVSLIEL
jgi:hypothetical protein